MLPAQHKNTNHCCLAALLVIVVTVCVVTIGTPNAIAAQQWNQAVSIAGTAGAGNEIVTKEFELPTAANVKIKWDLAPSGTAPLFRATLETYDAASQKYVNAGVLVRAVAASNKEQAGKLPAGKHRVTFAMKRMRYKFSIHYQR